MDLGGEVWKHGVVWCSEIRCGVLWSTEVRYIQIYT